MPKGSTKKSTSANLGFEAKLWAAADALRNNMDAAEYKHVVLGLIFLKYISDAFEAQARRARRRRRPQGADPEDPDEYRAASIFWVPKEARWSHLQGQRPAADHRHSSSTTRWPPSSATTRRSRACCPRTTPAPASTSSASASSSTWSATSRSAAPADRAKDTLGRVYEYFLAQFASAEGKKGGQFYTPSQRGARAGRDARALQGPRLRPLLRLGRHVRAAARSSSRPTAASSATSRIYGQESNYTTWRLAKMNLAIRGIDAQIAHGDTFHNDRHPDLKADYVLANPPFNDSDWRGELLKDDKRWVYGVPPAGNANFAWVQHFIHHLAPTGLAGFVLANGSMSSNQSGEGEIRKAIIEADLVDCMVALPGQLFYSTQIPVCLWFLARNKKNGRFRDRRGETLFIDARKLGTMVDRVHRELTDDDIAKIAGTYHAWRGDKDAGEYADVPGFCKARHARRHPQARPRAHARPLRRRRGRRGRRRAVRGEDEAARRDAARAAGRGREAGCRHRRQPEGAWVWRVSGATSRSASCSTIAQRLFAVRGESRMSTSYVDQAVSRHSRSEHLHDRLGASDELRFVSSTRSTPTTLLQIERRAGRRSS